MTEMEENRRLELAVYGKGGIGKSTISANLSAAFTLLGIKVLQIGCDPKHDSTRLLLGNRKIPTVLDYLKTVPEDEAGISRILYPGWCGIGCIEAGGPRPGVGCAGRGIISTFEFLSRHKVKEEYDAVIYDVLGDVVCGGFAVPIRREYANTVVLVTSGEFMSIYAANNILRGIRNFDGDQYRRVAGIIYNARNVAGEAGRVGRFARAVKLPILAEIPRSEAFVHAEEKNVPIADLEGYEEEKQIFLDLAEKLSEELILYNACPLSDEELEEIVLGGAEAPKITENNTESVRYAEEPEAAADNIRLTDADREADPSGAGPQPLQTVKRPPLYGCAFTGAATTAVGLTDAIVIAHSPRACAFYTWQNITSSGRKGLFNRGILLPSAISPHFACTDITESEAVYGGTDKVRELVKKAVGQKPGAVIVISSCVSGIIGDDILSLEELSTEETPVITIPADGDAAGDYMKGIQMCLRSLAKHLIRTEGVRKERSVNLIGEVSLSTTLESNFRNIKDLLGRLGVTINCRFLGNARTADIKNFMAASLNILASENADNLALKQWFEEEFGCTFFDMPLPTGFEETALFTEKIADFFGCPEKVAPILDEERRKYKESIEKLRPVLAGKKLLLTTISTGMDWLFSAALDAGMEIVWVGVADYLHQGMIISRDPEVLKVSEFLYDINTAVAKIKDTEPDIVVSNYTSAYPQGSYVLDVLPMLDVRGFSSGVHTLEHWAKELEHTREGEWANDRILYQKYFS